MQKGEREGEGEERRRKEEENKMERCLREGNMVRDEDGVKVCEEKETMREDISGRERYS